MEYQDFSGRDSLQWEEQYKALKSELEIAIKQSHNSDDLKEAKNILILVQSRFKDYRLKSDDREELYKTLQEEFTRVNERIASEKIKFEQEAYSNYVELKMKVEEAVYQAGKQDDWREGKHYLIEVQNAFKGLKLIREQREELYAKVQQAFDTLNQRMDEERQMNKVIAEENFEFFLAEVTAIEADAKTVITFKDIRDRIRNLQATLRDSVLLRDQKDQLYASLQESFQLINTRQDHERSSFDNEAEANYKHLNKMVTEGLNQAQESTEFRETREFLKKIQGEFKGIRMQKEQREELYSRLQTAFGILRERTDTYFREKQKNWEVKMEFRLKDLSVHILELQMIITKDKERLEELENQLDILEQKPADSPAKLMVQAQLQSVRASIHKNEMEIIETSKELEALQLRLGSDPEVPNS